MKITRDNYEPFFLDYLEGNLEENMIDQFLDFLEQHPDLKEELQMFENVRLPDEKIIFPEKQQLYKSGANEEKFIESKMVAYLEGDLDDEGRKSFETYLASHSELQNEYKLYTKTRLLPDAGITYPDRKKLYRKAGATIILGWVARAVAAIVLIWGINSLIQTVNQPGLPEINTEFAENSPTSPSPVQKTEQVKIASVVDSSVKVTNEANPGNSQSIHPKAVPASPESLRSGSELKERDSMSMVEILPIPVKLETEPVEPQLAVSRSENMQKINDPRNIMTLDEFLASRAKKVSNEGLFSAQRIVRAGLEVASELTGERIGYSMKDGKIASVGFESKLMAFSIPLTKK